jgi:hypothetical protein
MRRSGRSWLGTCARGDAPACESLLDGVSRVSMTYQGWVADNGPSAIAHKRQRYSMTRFGLQPYTKVAVPAPKLAQLQGQTVIFFGSAGSSKYQPPFGALAQDAALLTLGTSCRSPEFGWKLNFTSSGLNTQAPLGGLIS